VNGELLVQATDRYVAARETVPAQTEGELAVSAEAKPAADTLKTLLKIAGNTRALAEQPVITITHEADAAFCSFTLSGHIGPDTTLTVPVVDADYPKMGQFFPADDEGEYLTGPVQLGSAHLAKFTKVTDDQPAKVRTVRFQCRGSGKPA